MYKGTYFDQREDKDVAIKVLDQADSNDTQLLRETSALSCLNHHNIIRFYGICQTNSKPSESIIVMEFANLGTLIDHFQELTHSQASKVCLDMYQGLQYLHRKKYIHRDMKLENILLVGDNLNAFMAKIADFGLSRRIAPNMTVGLQGTPLYMAPELIQAQQADSDYNYKVDIYSSTIIIFELFSQQRFPFPITQGNYELERAILRSVKPKIPSHMPLQTLIAKGWSREPQKRPEVDEFIEAFKEHVTAQLSI